jgi:hypothetical protein
VETTRTSPPHDPEFDPPRRPGPRPSRPPFLPQEYQRLVANPFLALVGLIAWVAAFRWALIRRSLAEVGIALLGLVAVFFLLQYHCLDCGATGLLYRWKSHACECVRARQEADRVRRFRGPNPVLQTVFWGYLLAGAAVLAVAFYQAVRR